MDMSDHIVGHARHMAAIDDPTRGETKEVIVALGIAGRAHCQGANSTRCHAVVMLLMSLDILSKLVLAVPIEIDGLAGDDGVGTQGNRHPT
jgi:hypothetical protein